MPRMIDLIRASAVPATRMQAAARGALTVPAAEMIEILVHLANHNKIFSQQAKLTLAGWDEASALAVAADPRSSAEVLEYMISPHNLRPRLLAALLENPTVTAESIIQLATSGSRETVDAILKSKRCGQSPAIQNALASNPNFRAAESAALEQMEASNAEAAAVPPDSAAAEPEHASRPVQAVEESSPATPAAPPTALEPDHAAPSAETHKQAEASSAATEASNQPSPEEEAPDPAVDQGLATYLTENAAEIAAEEGKPFRPIGGMDELRAEPAATVAEPIAPAAVSPSAPHSAASAPKTGPKKPHLQPDGKRDNTVQKINKLDVKGRIQLAMKGSKEERSILIRDGTKIVALAVLESPKVSDGEVEHFAAQKNVLEAVLRAIPMKRRFVKQYGVLRSLVANPRTPLDVSLGLMKHMLVQDLKNLSGNKEISDTVRKLALKMFKQKMETTKKD